MSTFKKIQQKYTTATIASRLKLYGNEQKTKIYKDTYMPTILELVNIGGNGPKKQRKLDKLGGFHLLWETNYSEKSVRNSDLSK